MQRHLTTKTIIIVATILLCLYGIFGIPKSGADIEANLRKNIRLGLDLKGGSYLVLQVQVQDAIKSVAQRTIDGMKEELRKAGIDFTNIDRNDPTTIQQADSIQINVQGIPAQKSGDFRSLIAERFPQWKLTPVDSTTYTLNMKPSELVDVKRQCIDQSIQTINNRVNALGLTEPSVQQYGRADSEIRNPGATARRGRSGSRQGPHRPGSPTRNR